MVQGRNHSTYSFLLAVTAVICGSCFWWSTRSIAQDARVNVEPRTSTAAPSVGSADRLATLRTTVDLVLIPVVVTDKQDRLITGLEKDHFKLFEDKVEQVITHFVTEIRRRRSRLCSIAAAVWVRSCKNRERPWQRF